MNNEIKFMLDKHTKKWTKKSKNWILPKYFNLIIYNLILLFLFLLRSAGYFHPFFEISVNIVVIVALVLSVILLGARSTQLFAVALVFWLFAGFLRLVGVNIWAERTAIYVYQALTLGAVILAIETLFGKKVNRRNNTSKSKHS